MNFDVLLLVRNRTLTGNACHSSVPFIEKLRDVMTVACVCLQVQGMSFIAAVLLLNMDVDDAFICFANLLNRPCQIAFFRLDECLVSRTSLNLIK